MDTLIWFLQTTAIGLVALAAILAAIMSFVVAAVGTEGVEHPSRKLKLLVAGTRAGWLLVLGLMIGLLLRPAL